VPQQEYRTGHLVLFVTGALLIAIVLGWYLLPIENRLDSLHGWLLRRGVLGILIFCVIYVVGAVILAPEGLLTVGAGFAYGFWGLPIVILAATIGASLSFLIARYFAREKVRRLLRTRRNIIAIDKAAAEDGWKIVVLLRLNPLVPFGLQNYLFGVTSIRFGEFVAATFVGIIPGTTLYTYIGLLGSAVGDGGLVRWVSFCAGFLVTVAVVFLATRKAGAKLRESGVRGDSVEM
jgi:uncharacterized membrane protein YdjX (TVP38/TMEM64 family)